jgi:hypothetical protein
VTFDCKEYPDFLWFQNNAGWNPQDYVTSFRIQPGFYSSMNDVVQVINDLLERSLKRKEFPVSVEESGYKNKIKLLPMRWPRLRYDEVENKVKVHLQPGGVMKFDSHLASIIGMDDLPVTNHTSAAITHSASRVADINARIAIAVHLLRCTRKRPRGRHGSTTT